MVIPANAENPALAHEFINYVLSYDACLMATRNMWAMLPPTRKFWTP